MNENFNLVEETNVSNQVETTRVSYQSPKCLNKFNWGAFVFPWIWGFVYGCTLWAILAFIPYVNIVIAFVAGFTGNRRAWEKNKGIMSAKEFDKKQVKWDTAGKVYFGVICSIFIIIIMLLFILYGI